MNEPSYQIWYSKGGKPPQKLVAEFSRVVAIVRKGSYRNANLYAVWRVQRSARKTQAHPFGAVKTDVLWTECDGWDRKLLNDWEERLIGERR